ncbi:heme-binding protein [Frankia sp. AgB32]|uniref:GlcG/HbpS family heme-binding protein n=1 Tax=Frankia sp. AgB32 TaxID=631119 RepID=UPI00200DC729|nr:heme-binding protein [Frankia sp. AgB32]MCK9895522.1 heme-binding protein [Frankia sp. AgB32]
MTVSLEDARRIIAAGERYAIHLGQPVNIAVVDHAGILVAHVRMDNARLRTADISVERACAARVAALPARLVNHAGGGPGDGEWDVVPAQPGSGLTGAVPLRRDGLIVGAVGVSGGPTPHDEAIARAAAAAF